MGSWSGAPDFGAWTVIAATQAHGEFQFRPFLRVESYRPRCHVLREPEGGGFEVKVEGGQPGTFAHARHVPAEQARAVADALAQGYGWKLASAGDT